MCALHIYAATCTVTPSDCTAAIAGGSTVIAVLVLLLFLAVVVIVCQSVQLRKHKHPLSDE